MPNRSLNTLALPQPGHDLCIRYWRQQDSQCVVDAAVDPYVPSITSIPRHCDTAGAVDWINRQNAKIKTGHDLPLCIARHCDDQALGMIGLFGLNQQASSAGYWLSPTHRGQSIVKHILNGITPWAFSVLAIQRLELFIEPDNLASAKTARNAGFSYGKTLKAYMTIDGTARDMVLFYRQAVITTDT